MSATVTVKYRPLSKSKMCTLHKIKPYLCRKRTLFVGAAFLFYILCYKRNGVQSQRLLPYVVVHLDLKGAPPTIDFLISLIGTLKKYGANALLIEYEDMFPFEGSLADLRAENAYTVPELQRFLVRALELGFDIIPLVQTFAHMEYVLKHDEFWSLREHPDHPEVICPSRAKSRQLISSMLEQIIRFHGKLTKLKYIHVGCDEVEQLNSCKYCLQRSLENMELFQDHVRFVYNTVKNFTPSTKVLIWDDMLRAKSDELVSMGLQIELVCWYYHDFPGNNINIDLHDYYGKKFENVWAATAFKGADGTQSILPNIAKRFVNHFDWVKYLVQYKQMRASKMPQFQGIILTGWSRYNHFSPVCDVLSASIHSLVINLLLTKEFNSDTFQDEGWTEQSFYDKHLQEAIQKELDCQKTNKLTEIDGQSCKFLGHSLNAALKVFQDFSLSIPQFEQTVYKKMTEHVNGNVQEFEEHKSKLIGIIEKELGNLTIIKNTVFKTMRVYHDKFTVASFIKEQFGPVEEKIKWLASYVATDASATNANDYEFESKKESPWGSDH